MAAGSSILRPIRPRLRLCTPLEPDVALARIDRALGAADCHLVGSVLDGHVELLIQRRQRHFWSPWLSAEVRPEENGTLITGRFGPHPNLWTLFVALYAIWSFCAIGALVYGYSQWTLGRSPNALWGVPLAVLIAMLQYVVSIVGQGLGKRQMGTMGRFVRLAIEAPDERAD